MSFFSVIAANMESGKVIISVSNDLVTDQRVNRTALTFMELGFSVVLVGRKQRKSLGLEERPYRAERLSLIFEKGPLFYFMLNFRLFFYLLFHKADVLYSNDLDTLLANYLVSKIKGVPIIYDSHEYFTGVPELQHRPMVKLIWQRIEKIILPKLKNLITVNESIAALYLKEYNVRFSVVRNIPIPFLNASVLKRRSEFGIPEDQFVFLFQGAGINVDRGGEEAIEAISITDGAVLLFIGGGDVMEVLKQKVLSKGLSSKVFFLPKQPFFQLAAFTRMADFGLTLDKDTNVNYRYSLPNKLFDYIHNGLPVLATDLPEVAGVVRKYNIGVVSTGFSADSIALAMKAMMDKNKIASWKENLKLAASELNWAEEKKKLIKVIHES